MHVPKPTSKKAGKTKEEIIAAIQEATGRLGRVPTSREFTPLSGISLWQVTGRFGTYGNAVRAAGLELSHQGMKMETAALLEDWGRVVRKVGALPTRRQYKEAGSYSPDCLADRFESWVRISAEFTRFVASRRTGGRLDGRGGKDPEGADTAARPIRDAGVVQRRQKRRTRHEARKRHRKKA